MTNKELYYANEDILYIVENVKSIGWNSIKEQSIQRIVYLSKVLYTFTHSGKIFLTIIIFPHRFMVLSLD